MSVRQTLAEVMTQQHGYLVWFIYSCFTELLFKARNYFGHREAPSFEVYK